MLDIHLYLGAHKTATTHLQGIMLANRQAMLGRGVALAAPQDVRREWLPDFFKYCNHRGEDRPALVRRLRAMAPDAGLWILSEENIIGVSNDFVSKPGIYPAGADRVGVIQQLFPDANIHFFFSIRSYDTFYRSAYSEVVRNRGYLPFEKFYDPERFAGNSWVTLVEQVEAVVSQENMTLWRFEDFRSLVPTLVGLLTRATDVKAMLDAYTPETTRPSLSSKTMDILALLEPVLKRPESLALVERLNRAYPVDRYGEYRPFTKQQEDVFQAQYETDVRVIRDRYPRLRFLYPTG